MGGEKLGRMAVAISVKGSPPHGRGKVDVVDERFDIPRITPAWAGKRSPGRKFRFASRDLPRMGGEKIAS